MADDNPLSDDEVEMLLHDVMQRLADARYRRGTETQQGAEALRVGMAGQYGGLTLLAKKARAG